MMAKYTLDPNQVQARNFAVGNAYSFNCMEMGCIAGDAEIKVNLSGSSRKRTLSDLYDYYYNRCKDTSKLRIRSYKGESQGIRLHDFNAVLKKGVKTCLELELEDGKKIKLTPDHEVMTSNGFKRADSLETQDSVMVDNLTKHQSKGDLKQKTYRKTRYNLWTVGDYYPYGHWTTGYKGKRVKRCEVHILKATAKLNNCSVEVLKDATWLPNFNETYETINPETHQVHHIDHDPKNNDISNLEIMSKDDHNRLHGDYAHFGHCQVNYSKVVKVSEVGKHEVFDIVCGDPHRNFVANGIVVHNCGKTLTALDAALASGARSVLIICPAYLKQNWRDEISKFFGDTYIKHEIQSYAGTKNLKAHDALILDEFHYIKSHKAQRTNRIFKYIRKHKPEMVLGLSGTPMKNSAWDFYPYFMILSLVHRIRFPRDPYAFQATFCRKIPNDFTPSGYSYEGINSDRKAELKELIRPYFYFTPKGMEPELPPVIEKKYMAGVPTKKVDLMVAAMDENRSQEFMALKAINAELNTKTTIKLIQDLVEQGKRPVVFTEHRASAAIIANKFNCKMIIGGVNNTTRSEILENFDKLNSQVLVGTYGAMGMGLNITSTDTMIFNDYCFSPSDYEQARKRIHRKGQTKTCFYHHVFSNDMDYSIFKKLMKKKGESDEIHRR